MRTASTIRQNKNAVGVGAILSKMYLRDADMVVVRSKGYIPTLMNGTEIGKVEIEA